MGQEKKIFTREMLEQMRKAGGLTQDQYQAGLRLVESNEEGKPIIEMTHSESMALRGAFVDNGLSPSTGLYGVPMSSITELKLCPIIILENHMQNHSKLLLLDLVDELARLGYQLLCFELTEETATSYDHLKGIDQRYALAPGYADVAESFTKKEMRVCGIDSHGALGLSVEEIVDERFLKVRNVSIAQTIRQMAPEVDGGIVCLLGAAHGKPVYDELKLANVEDGFADACIFVNTSAYNVELPPKIMNSENNTNNSSAKEIMEKVELEALLINGKSGMALRKAANANLPEYVRKIICEQGSGFINEAGDGSGMNSLHRACNQISSAEDDLAVVTYLLKQGADPTLRDNQNRLPVDLVKIGGEDEKRRISDFVYGLAFRRAATEADFSAMEEIVGTYGDAVIQLVGKDSQRNALHFVCAIVNNSPKLFGKYKDIIQWLIAASPAILEQTDARGNTPVELLENESVLRQFNSQIGSPSETTRSTAAPSQRMG